MGPTTLPADFGEWDSGAPPTTLPDNFDDFDADAVPKPPAKPVAASPAVSRAASRLPDSTASRAQTSAYADTEELPEPPRPKRARATVVPTRVPEVAVESDDEDESEVQGKGKGKVVFISIGAVVLVAVIIIATMTMRKSTPKTASPNQSVAQQTTTTLSPTDMSKPKPTAAEPAPNATPDTTTPEEAGPTAAQPDMMNKQLNAPSRIAGSIKTANEKDAAPAAGFGAVDMGASSGGPVGVFNGKNGPKVTAAPVNTPAPAVKSLNVSGSVMEGRAVSRTAPVYPSFARSARVEGTVVLHASISKAGTISNLSVMSGPTMLRQAALDAVKTWRYKPYLLNNEPVEVETTVNVVFVLGG
jgi:protein TonB